MKKLKDKLKLFKVMFPLLLGTIKFRVKVFLHKIFNKHNIGHSVSNITNSRKIVLFTVYLIMFFVFFHLFFLSAPVDFPVGTIVKIEQRSSLRNVSLKLKERHIIRSRLAFEAFVIILGKEKHVVFSDYYFENKLPVYEIARRIAKGEHHLVSTMITIPEGFNIKQIADAFASKLINFDKNKFLREATGLEGSLFPDTYFFFITADEADVLESMNKNFDKKIKSLRPLITQMGRTEKDIIIMASLIEGEAKGDIDRGFISGILWKRLGLGMPLQVDVAPETYKTKGLPENPIGNPGMAAIKVAIYPQNSNYLYYLHDKNGNIHYAKNFSEHQANIKKYLK